MTKLEELKAAFDAAWDVRSDARHAAFNALRDASALDAAVDAWADFNAAWADFIAVADSAWDARNAYQNELKKQSKAPREPVEDEGNPLV